MFKLKNLSDIRTYKMLHEYNYNVYPYAYKIFKKVYIYLLDNKLYYFLLSQCENKLHIFSYDVILSIVQILKEMNNEIEYKNIFKMKLLDEIDDNYVSLSITFTSLKAIIVLDLQYKKLSYTIESYEYVSNKHKKSVLIQKDSDADSMILESPVISANIFHSIYTTYLLYITENTYHMKI